MRAINGYDEKTHACIDGFVLSKESIWKWVKQEFDKRINSMTFEHPWDKERRQYDYR